MKDTAWGCPHCGRTNWGMIFVGIIISISLLAVSLIKSAPVYIFSRWILGISGAISLAIMIPAVVEGIRLGEKRKSYKLNGNTVRLPLDSNKESDDFSNDNPTEKKINLGEYINTLLARYNKRLGHDPK